MLTGLIADHLLQHFTKLLATTISTSPTVSHSASIFSTNVCTTRQIRRFFFTKEQRWNIFRHRPNVFDSNYFRSAMKWRSNCLLAQIPMQFISGKPISRLRFTHREQTQPNRFIRCDRLPARWMLSLKWRLICWEQYRLWKFRCQRKCWLKSTPE